MEDAMVDRATLLETADAERGRVLLGSAILRLARLALAEHEAQLASGYAQVAGGGAQERRDQASVLRMRVHEASVGGGAGGAAAGAASGRRLRLVGEGGEA
ncbi:MAG: hypothetical protein ACK5XO_01915 [Phycisphaerales bacterium]